METYSDSDTSSESEYDSGRGSAAVSDCDEDELSQDQDQDQDLEPEPSEDYEEYRNTLWNPDAQLQAQLDDFKLAQLHASIKARAEIPVDLLSWGCILLRGLCHMIKLRLSADLRHRRHLFMIRTSRLLIIIFFIITYSTRRPILAIGALLYLFV